MARTRTQAVKVLGTDNGKAVPTQRGHNEVGNRDRDKDIRHRKFMRNYSRIKAEEALDALLA